MINLPLLYSNKKLLKTDILLKSIKEDKKKIFNISFHNKLLISKNTKKTLNFLNMLVNYSIKVGNKNIQKIVIKKKMEFILKLSKEDKIYKSFKTDRKITLIEKEIVKSLMLGIKTNNKEIISGVLKFSNSLELRRNEEKIKVLNYALRKNNILAVQLILNSNMFSWIIKSFTSKQMEEAILYLGETKNYKLCSALINTLTYKANTYPSYKDLLIEQSLKNGDFDLFETKELNINFDNEYKLIKSLEYNQDENYLKIFKKYIDTKKFIIDDKIIKENLKSLVNKEKEDLLYKVIDLLKNEGKFNSYFVKLIFNEMALKDSELIFNFVKAGFVNISRINKSFLNEKLLSKINSKNNFLKLLSINKEVLLCDYFKELVLKLEIRKKIENM